MKESVYSRRGNGRTLREDPFLREPASGYTFDLRVYRLFVVVRQLEEFANRLSESEFNILLDEAILACGFADEVEALRATLDEFGDGLRLTMTN